LATSELTVLMEQAAAREVPIMVFVGNRHCIQIHTGPVNNLHWISPTAHREAETAKAHRG